MVIKEGNERMDNIQLLAKAIDELEDRIETLIDLKEKLHSGLPEFEVPGANPRVDALNEAIALMVHHRDFMVEELDKN